MRIDRIEFIKIVLMKKEDTILECSLDKNDRFNERMRKIIISGGKIQGLKNVGIDNVYIKPILGELKFTLDGRNIPQTETFDFYAECIAYEGDMASAIVVTIDKPIQLISCSDKSYSKELGIWDINMCELSIPYMSNIQVGILNS